jgi:phosphoribosylformylglycinamidine cyclo-ligase
MSDPKDPGLTYRDAGVDIDAQDAGLRRIKAMLVATRTPGVLADLGSFGGMFAPDLTGMKEPFLVASCDGVGTKLDVAFMTGIHDTVGRDLVNHCVNDILVQGAAPLFFLDYVATGKLVPEVLASIVEGMAAGCRETAALFRRRDRRMPGFTGGTYDVAGFIVGLVDKPRVIDGRVRVGDVTLSPARGSIRTAIRWHGDLFRGGGKAPGDSMDRCPSRSAPSSPSIVRTCRRSGCDRRGPVRGLAHHRQGMTDNLPRILPNKTAARIEARHLARASGVHRHVSHRPRRRRDVPHVQHGRRDGLRDAPENAAAFRPTSAAGEKHFRIGRDRPQERNVIYA